MNRRAIVLFTGDARRDSRQKGLPARFLSTLHRSLARTIRASGSSFILASDDGPCFTLSTPECSSVLACAGLGEKIDASFRFAFQLGYDSVLILAGDVVLDVETLSDAFAQLAAADDRAVIGRSGDGGFYLAGLRSDSGLIAIDWNQMPWFTSSCASALAAQFVQAGGTVSYLRSVDDVDSPGDAARITHSLSPRWAELKAILLSLLMSPRSTPRLLLAPLLATTGHAIAERSPPNA